MKASFLLLALLVAYPVWAAPTYDAVGINTSTSVSTLSATVTVGGGCTNPIIIATVAWWEGPIGSVTSFNIGGSPATFIAGVSPGSAGVNRRIEMWRRVGVSTGANTIQANMDGSKGAVTVSGRSYCGVHQTTPLGTAATYDNNGNDAVATVNVSSAPDQIVVDAVQTAGAATTLTIGAGQVHEVNNTAQTGIFLFGASDETGSGTTTMSWTTNTDDYMGIIAVPLIPAPTAATRRRSNVMIFQ